MEDWSLTDGGAENIRGGGNRNLQLITHQLTDATKSFSASVTTRRVEISSNDGGSGFRIGVKSELNEYRSNSFASGGINAGVLNNELILGTSKTVIKSNSDQNITLVLTGVPNGDQYRLTLKAYQSGDLLGSISNNTSTDAVKGNLAIVSNFALKPKDKNCCRYRFEDFELTGDSFTYDKNRKFGPILWSMYSLSDSRNQERFVLKLSALTGPLSKHENQNIELLIERDQAWISHGISVLDTDSWTATFRIPNWDESKPARYRLIYTESLKNGEQKTSMWQGVIRENPTDRPLRVASLTCQNDYAFPYEPVAENLARLDPDMLYFSGDQLYESHGGFGVIREPAELAILNYLRKFYMFGWAFRDVMRDRPTLCLPDDHDVFQGNIWGEGGNPMDIEKSGASSNGGYREPARMVNVVHRTNTGHHPDFDDPTPVNQGISVYHGEMIYGGVGFAIIADRQFKSGPQRVETGSGRADHVRAKDFDTALLDKPGLALLGERQEQFLKRWADDWRGHSMKVLLSQTVFAGVATHHGRLDGYLKADLDSGGWPQTARDRAIEIINPARALHLNGDQHMTSLVQYGTSTQRDGCWSFCSPAIGAGYQRWWRPDQLDLSYKNRPDHGLPNTGEYLDGFGNLVYVYAVGNPEVGTKKHRYEKAHQKGSGFGLVTIDIERKTYQVEAFRFLVDATSKSPSTQFPGWPVVIHQSENPGENRLH